MIRTFAIAMTGIALLMSACTGQEENKEMQAMYLGADLSYLNEMIDCGGVFRSHGEVIEPYAYFAESGANIVRLRLWHNPGWTDYSSFEDVKRSIVESHRNGMEVLLDFHYSDTWADPQKQLIPEAWKGIDSLEVLGDSVYAYTYRVLMDLYREKLLPEFVQVGNETNSEILMEEHAPLNGPINWKRNAFLLNRGIEAVRDLSEDCGQEIGLMLHIAQPENALWWFREASDMGVTDYDWIGLSYYPKWSEYSIHELGTAIDSLIGLYNKRLMIVETAYSYGFADVDSAGNILEEDAIIPGFPATPRGQHEFMLTLTEVVRQGGGEGVIYWEPAWISTDCRTLWGKGSHWENATFFDAENGNEALPAFGFFKYGL